LQALEQEMLKELKSFSFQLSNAELEIETKSFEFSAPAKLGPKSVKRDNTNQETDNNRTNHGIHPGKIEID
jgi:hypothetical protein